MIEGGIVKGGVEYFTYPPPCTLVKVMEYQWATNLIKNGSMRFGSLEFYRKMENAALGDPNDGKGMFRVKGDPYTIDSSNNIYAWCAALPVITPERIAVLAKHGKYDCLIRIHQPKILLHRVIIVLLANGGKLHLRLQCAEVSYNRGSEIDKATLNSQQFHFNVFQKDPRFAEDKEYRLFMTDVQPESEPRNHIDIQVGDCSDIMDIEDLPN